MDLNYILRSILALIVIIWLANVLLGKLNKYTQGQSKAIQVIECFSINKNSSLAIVKIVNHYYLMSFNENSSEILKEFAVAEVDEILEVMQSQQDTKRAEFFTQIDFTEIKEKYAKFFEKESK